MGLIKAITGATDGVLADQWREFFYGEEMTPDVLVMKGQKRLSSQGRSSNTSGEDNIISNGSVIAVNAGQCMIIVESGKVVEVCAEPGEFVYDTSTEPSILTGTFEGHLGENILNVFRQIGKRFTFGGDPGKDQRVYYFNIKEIIGNKYGTPNLIPFPTILDLNGVQKKLMVRIKCFGEYSYRIVNPVLFYTNVTGNVDDTYQRTEIDSQLKTELLTALQPAFAKIGATRISYDELPAHTMELANALNEVLSAKWRDLRGIEIVSFGVSSVRADEEDEKRIMDAQNATFYTDPSMAAARLVGAQSEAMVTAAGNESGMGAAMGFMGMGMAGQAGGMNAANLFAMGQQPPQAPPPPAQQAPPPMQAAPAGGAAAGAAAGAGSWTCACGESNTGKFCKNCGQPKPAPQGADGWTCACGHTNVGNFCTNCGTKRPTGAPLLRCDKCGWQPEDPAHPPKFCPECGDVFDESDRVQ